MTHLQRLSLPCRTLARSAVAAAVTFAVLVLPGTFPHAAADDEPAEATCENVLLITLDGLRPQDLFTGADETLLNRSAGGVRNTRDTREAFWRETPEQRRIAMMPWFWQTIAAEGVVFGDTSGGSIVRVTNEHRFSYPGYNEILTGVSDPRIDSNAKRNNDNVTVLEWLHSRPGLDGRVAAFCSWDVFPYIINADRSGIPVNAGWEPLAKTVDTAATRALDALAAEMPRYWDNVRYDYFTFRGAHEYLKQKQPRLLYVAFGETDDWAHDGRYDLYLDAARRTDDYIRQLWETAQSMPQYRGKTALVITTDHGRGDTREEWKSHGESIAGSEFMWIAVLGPGVKPQGPEPGTVTQAQVAATVATLLGYDYRGDVPEAGEPLPLWPAKEESGNRN
ncbi:Type I phosphodiesterase / nucleotide pyrophosphatase [Maioricimonas rarisocia]|uniref:Type I phosphodiesterase / nucleotide pyrophosphatase n=1 Tax=Maioricimonas rarisocia TaxID=2528026 RepID=A0A517ZEN4_9PLAN|nr:alkaline phosphatase family protein [Maioricimonas rarisocia]QDU40932.1 Type I phosphodiesterase / nucleotide pyrophosphatase [Maioricimonas rarisocia]